MDAHLNSWFSCVSFYLFFIFLIFELFCVCFDFQFFYILNFCSNHMTQMEGREE